MESAFTGSAEKPIAELTSEMKLGAKQLCHLLVNTVRGKALTLFRSAEKHHGIAAWKRIKSEYQPDAAGRHTAMLMGIMQPGWDSRNAANFMDQLTEWERRIQEYEGESLETFSYGMKIAVLASHAPESIRNLVRLAAGPAGGKYRVVRQNMSECLQYGRVFDKDGRGVDSEASSASATPMDVDAVGKCKGKGCFVCGRPGHAAKDCKFNQAKSKAQGKGKAKNTPPDKNTPAKFEGECRHCGKKGHKWAECRKRLAEANDKKVHAFDGTPTTATVVAVEDKEENDEAGICGDWSDDEDDGVDTSEAWVLSVEGDRSQLMLSSSHSTALVKNTPVRGTLLKEDVIWVFRMCS